MKPILLDLFAGCGGATKGYQRAGFQVIGIDRKAQPNYCGETFWQTDALEHLSEALDKFYPFNYVDVIHASPPCQRWSSKTRSPESHPDLITPLRPMLEATEIPYIIENVPEAPLINPTMLCGSSFGLGVQRHRCFETNFPLLAPSCAHGQQEKRYRLYDHGKWYMSRVVHVFGTGGGKGREHWQEAMGIDWTNDTDELREAIPPAFTEHIGLALMQHLERKAA